MKNISETNNIKVHIKQ